MKSIIDKPNDASIQELAAIIYSMFKSEYLIKKHCPNLSAFLKKHNYRNWDKLDNSIQEQLSNEQTIRTNLVRLLLRAEESENSFLGSFAKHIDDLIAELFLLIPQYEKGLWKSLEGKFDNIHDWNYLNPIGEFSVLKKLLDNKKFELIKFEADFPNYRPKDFLLKSKSDNSYKYIEVVNIHLPVDLADNNEAKKILLQKLNKKIQRETENVTDMNLLSKLIICPVVWYLTTNLLADNITFFADFSTTFGKSENIDQKTLGFCTYVKTIDNQFIFGEASSIVQRYKF